MGIGQARVVLRQAIALLKQEAPNAQLLEDGELIDACEIIADLDRIETALYWQYEAQRPAGMPRDAEVAA